MLVYCFKCWPCNSVATWVRARFKPPKHGTIFHVLTSEMRGSHRTSHAAHPYDDYIPVTLHTYINSVLYSKFKSTTAYVQTISMWCGILTYCWMSSRCKNQPRNRRRRNDGTPRRGRIYYCLHCRLPHRLWKKDKICQQFTTYSTWSQHKHRNWRDTMPYIWPCCRQLTENPDKLK